MPVIVTTPDKIGGILREHHKHALDTLVRAIVTAAFQGQRVLRAHVPVDTGELRRETQMHPTGARSGTIAEVVENTPYAAITEAGTRPFTPPIAPLLAWVKRQAANLGIDSTDEDELRRVAYGVQHAIAQRGIRATWHTRDAQDELGALLHRQLDAAVRQLSAGQ